MASIGEARTITNRRQSPEEGIRLSLYANIHQSGADPSGFLDALAYAVKHEVWRKLPGDGDRPLTFRQFIEAPYPLGIGSSVNVVLKLAQLPHRHEAGSLEKRAELAGMRERVRKLMEVESPEMPGHGEVGGGHGRVDMSTLPASGRGGNSREYSLARLKRDRPDLAEMVIAGELSANAAAIEAGFRRRDSPLDALRRAWGKATDDERAQFMNEVARD